ncbi:MAG: tRNA 2-thiocytidine(32) synthetase TtcA [Pseudobdellovibrionaceae bacterium]
MFNHPLALKIRKQIVQALNDFSMLQNQDHVMVCVSGGKDSSILLALLTEIQRRAEIEFTLQAVMLDQKQPGFSATAFSDWVQALGVPLKIIERDTYSIVKEKTQGSTYCALCSRLRRAILYDHAFENKFTKMALGHHREDLLQTLLLNLFYSGKIASMPAKLLSDDKRNVVIRPLAYVAEKDLQELATAWQVPIIPCNLCGSQEGLKRKKVEELLQQLEGTIPNVRASMLTALSQVQASQLLDSDLWNFTDI